MNLFEITNEPVLEALYDFNEKVDDLISECYVVNTLVESCSDPDILFEEAENAENKTAENKNKIINFFKELWIRISDWFDRLINKVKEFFNSHKNFYKKHEKEINDNFNKKKVTLNTVKTYDIKGALNEYTKLTTDMSINIVEKIVQTQKSQDNITTEDIKGALFKKMSSTIGTQISSENEIKEHVNAKYTQVKENANYTVDEKFFNYLKDVVNYNDKFITTINKHRKYTQAVLNDCIRVVTGQEDVKKINITKRVNNIVVNVISIFPQFATQYVTEATNYAVSVLKKFVTSES